MMPDAHEVAEGKQKRNKGLIFELEGVGIDMRDRLATALRAALEDHADSLTHAFLCRHLHVTSPEALAASAAAALGLRASARDALRKKLSEARMDALMGGHANLAPGVADLLERASSQGLRIAAASGMDEESAKACLARLELDRYDVLPLQWSAERPASGSENWTRATRQLEVPAGACVAVVGSAEAVRDALVAGLRCVAVAGAFTAHHDFSGADQVVDSAADMDLRKVPGLGVG